MITLIHAHILPAALSLLPPEMDTPNARAEVLTIGLQESRFEHRWQVRGPAHGFFQFEYAGGVMGVASHHSTRDHLAAACTALRYHGAQDVPETLYRAIEHNDVLACVCARLLLWTLPQALPGQHEAQEGWEQYIAAWRPGRPHRDTWDAYHRQAWEVVSSRSLSPPPA